MEWKKSDRSVPYEDGVALMEARVAGIHAGAADDMVWLLEHDALYTAGTSAKREDLIDARFPVHKTGRGGQYTYHGPGQRIAYVMVDLKARAQNHCLPCESRDLGRGEKDPRFHGESITRKAVPDIKRYVCDLEEWIIRSMAEFDITAERRAGRVGIWVDTADGEKKIAAVGVRIRHWITFHGVSINVDPDLSHFEGIVPCGISEHGVTSMRELLGRDVSMDELDEVLQRVWGEVF